jgi:hypothetical protein
MDRLPFFLFYYFNFIFLPRKSVYKTVSGVIDPQIRPLSSSASKHSPRRNRQVIINPTEVKRWKSCIRHIVKIVSCSTEVSMSTWLSFVDETLHVYMHQSSKEKKREISSLYIDQWALIITLIDDNEEILWHICKDLLSRYCNALKCLEINRIHRLHLVCLEKTINKKNCPFSFCYLCSIDTHFCPFTKLSLKQCICFCIHAWPDSKSNKEYIYIQESRRWNRARLLNGWTAQAISI